jgi:signal transduction histidine kinase
MRRKIHATRSFPHSFQPLLKALHDVSMELARATTFMALCRQAVELGRARLGFDRLGIWLLDEDPTYMVGTFGTDEQGNLRDEHGARILSSMNYYFKTEGVVHEEPITVVHDAPIFDDQQRAVGQGWTAVAALWDGNQVIGCICADNLLERRPLAPHQRALLGLYGAALGHLSTRLRNEEALRNHESQLMRVQQLETIGRLASSVAHDFNNILTVIEGYCSLLADEQLSPEEGRDAVGHIGMATERAKVLTRQLLALSRRHTTDTEEVDLNLVVADLEVLVRRLVGEQIQVCSNLAAGKILVRAAPGQMQQVILNLVLNARDAMPGGGRLTLTTGALDCVSHASWPTGDCAVLTVGDTGVGMTEAVRQRLFEPFFTTKPWGKGTGLGLATVEGIVKQCGGWITVASEPGEGSEFQVFLPRVIPQQQTGSEAA